MHLEKLSGFTSHLSREKLVLLGAHGTFWHIYRHVLRARVASLIAQGWGNVIEEYLGLCAGILFHLFRWQDGAQYYLLICLFVDSYSVFSDFD